MDSYKIFSQNKKDTSISAKESMMTMTCWPFLKYWLYAAFPHCHGLQRYLLKYLPYSQEWMDRIFGVDKDQEVTPIRRSVVIDWQEVTVLLYRYHVEYRMGERELLRPCFSYHTAKVLDNDTFFLLLPMIDLSENGYEYRMPDLIQRMSETALPTEDIEEVIYDLVIGLAEADGAEDEPFWTIWQETVDSLYGAEWWQDAEEFHLFRQRRLDESSFPKDVYISFPMREDIVLWGKRILSKWISSLSKG